MNVAEAIKMAEAAADFRSAGRPAIDALVILVQERRQIIRAIEQSGFRLMSSGSTLFLLNVQDEDAA